MPNEQPWRPSLRFEGFYVYNNPDGTFHILVVAGNGGYIFADNLQDKDDAEWTAALLNAAIGVAAPLDKQGK
jgi:hypothetical protein